MFFILEAGFIFKPQAIRQKDYHQAIRLSLDGKVCQSQIERSPTGPSRKFPSAGGGRSPPADCSGEIKRTRWESGKAAFAFPLFHRAVAGAVEMWESRLLLARFPRGCGKRGKPAFGFPRFP